METKDGKIIYKECLSVSEQAKLFTIDLIQKKQGIKLESCVAKKILDSMTNLVLEISIDTNTGEVLIISLNDSKLIKPISNIEYCK